MLALPVSPPVVPGSANLPFLSKPEAEGELESNEWEGVRDFIPGGPASLVVFVRVGFAPSAALWSPLSVRDDVALSRLVVLDREAMVELSTDE